VDKNTEYGRIYSEITKGFSSEKINGETIYFKHPTIAEHFSNYSNYEGLINEGRRRGLFSEEEKVQDAIDGGWWTKEKESQIIFLQNAIKNLIKTKEKLLYKSQKTQIEKQIKRNESLLITYTRERREIVGYTVEDFVNGRITEQLLIFFAYKDTKFKEKLFNTADEYYNSQEYFLEKLKNVFMNYSDIFKDHNIKRVAASGFFQNLVYLNEDAYSFWGIPTAYCSKYQIDVLLYGKMYKRIIKNYSENGKDIPENVLYSPDNFVEWTENRSNDNAILQNRTERKSGSNVVSSYVGATAEDLKDMGVTVEKIKGKSLLELAAENGGILEKSDYFNARKNM